MFRINLVRSAGRKRTAEPWKTNGEMGDREEGRSERSGGGQTGRRRTFRWIFCANVVFLVEERFHLDITN